MTVGSNTVDMRVRAATAGAHLDLHAELFEEALVRTPEVRPGILDVVVVLARRVAAKRAGRNTRGERRFSFKRVVGTTVEPIL